MLREQKKEKQMQLEVVMIEELVPQDHLLRKIDKAVDFSFIHDMCRSLYSPNIGRPAIEPELLFRMLFIGYLYGIKSETRLAQEVNENIAYKWFLGLGLTEKGPDHATISINRVRRFKDNNIAEQIFNEILKQCIRERTCGWRNIIHGYNAYKSKGKQISKTACGSKSKPKGIYERTG